MIIMCMHKGLKIFVDACVQQAQLSAWIFEAELIKNASKGGQLV